MNVRGMDSTHKSRRRERGMNPTPTSTIRERGTTSTLIGRRASRGRNSSRDPTDPPAQGFEPLAEELPLANSGSLPEFGRLGKPTRTGGT